MELWSAFLIGLMGSAHCVGMCGPIALSLPYGSGSKLGRIKNILLYNFGRVFSYAIIGIIPGLLGIGFSIAGQQKTLSVAVGVIIIIVALFSLGLERKFLAIPFIQKLAFKVQNKLRELLNEKERKTFVGIGFVNGFLPCGLVYMALAGALIQSNIALSVTYMVFFGLGTIPLMMFVALAGNIVSLKVRNSIKKVMPIFMILMGVYFIYRGLNIDLPSNLQVWIDSGAKPSCH